MVEVEAAVTLVMLPALGAAGGFLAGFLCGRLAERRRRPRQSAEQRELVGQLKDISDGIRRLGENNAVTGNNIEKLMADTKGITRVLAGTKTRGQYAELHIERILEIAGLEKNIHYKTQKSVGKLRPDFVVHLGGGRDIIIDSKAPLDALQRVSEADNDATRDSELKNHVKAVRRHITELSKLEYWRMEKRPALEFVVMAVPEYALLPALQSDPKLADYALEKKVVLVSPHILTLLLRALNIMWRQKQMGEAVREVAEMSADMHNGLVKFIDEYNQTGTHLQKTVATYNQSTAAWRSGVHPAAERLKKAGGVVLKTPESSHVDDAVYMLQHTEETAEEPEKDGAV